MADRNERSTLADQTQGQDDIVQSLFTSFCPYNRSWAFALVSQEKRLISRDLNPKRTTQKPAGGFRLLQILLDPEDQEIFAFGTKEANSNLQLLAIPASDDKPDLTIAIAKKEIAEKLKGMTHQSRFIAAINTRPTGAGPQRHLLLAVMEGSTIRIVRVKLDHPS